MSSLHIVGFGKQPNHKIKARIHWIPSFPKSPIDIEPEDVVVLNLNEVHDVIEFKVIIDLLNFIRQYGGVLVGISGPNINITSNKRRHDFLPFPGYSLKGIHTFDSSFFQLHSTAPDWVQFFLECTRRDLIAPVYFERIPKGVHTLIGSHGDTVGFSYQYEKGKILILPSIKSIIYGETTSSAKDSLAGFLRCLYNYILLQYMEPSNPPPEWLDSIVVRNEEELKIQYDTLGKEIQRIREEKTILVDDGHTLTRKVASHLDWLGFQTVEKEIEGKQDIEISDDNFKGVVECSGSVKHIKIDKLRQLMDYAIEQGVKGIIIGNPWREKHPNSREISEAFTEPVVRRAEAQDICLVTVPHLYRVCLDIHADEKKKVRDSLKGCKGLWQYPAKDW